VIELWSCELWSTSWVKSMGFTLKSNTKAESLTKFYCHIVELFCCSLLTSWAVELGNDSLQNCELNTGIWLLDAFTHLLVSLKGQLTVLEAKVLGHAYWEIARLKGELITLDVTVVNEG